jgi:PTH1 family peptidyl-tRNA hydrolase
MSYIIAGLGNPGEEYLVTRHNTGRIILETLAKKYDFPEFKENIKNKALVSEGKIGKEKVTLIEPNNFMNNSGKSLPPLIKSIKAAQKLIVIYDDLDVSLGKFKLSYNKSSGGHRGLESVIKTLKTMEFIRIRVGISPTTPSGKMKKPIGPGAVEKHILGEFKKPELDTLKKVSKTIIEAIATITDEGYQKAVSSFGNK